MDISFTKLFAKILVFPAVFSFALACCGPIFVQASKMSDSHTTQPHLEEKASHSHVEEGHDCDHEEHHGQGALQAPTQKIAIDLVFLSPLSSPISFYQYSKLDSQSSTLPRITGPPWDGKSIKAFLGVYRS